MFIMEKLLYNFLVSRKLCHLFELSMIVLGWSRFVLLIKFVLYTTKYSRENTFMVFMIFYHTMNVLQ